MYACNQCIWQVLKVIKKIGAKPKVIGFGAPILEMQGFQCWIIGHLQKDTVEGSMEKHKSGATCVHGAPAQPVATKPGNYRHQASQ